MSLLGKSIFPMAIFSSSVSTHLNNFHPIQQSWLMVESVFEVAIIELLKDHIQTLKNCHRTHCFVGQAPQVVLTKGRHSHLKTVCRFHENKAGFDVPAFFIFCKI